MVKGPVSAVAASIKRRGTKGKLHRALGVSEGEKIPTEKIVADRSRLRKKKKHTPADTTRLREENWALQRRAYGG
jgi:hypothetical protein